MAGLTKEEAKKFIEYSEKVRSDVGLSEAEGKEYYDLITQGLFKGDKGKIAVFDQFKNNPNDPELRREVNSLLKESLQEAAKHDQQLNLAIAKLGLPGLIGALIKHFVFDKPAQKNASEGVSILMGGVPTPFLQEASLRQQPGNAPNRPANSDFSALRPSGP
ncbi:hypothetical protein L3V82_01275 [Thiotrichales bacterium 19S3-7]|nr:hypothetical protein [Thiotrichales bacterium 19S3-7]MCF6800793.1 hypothetical protein [Thiotrichales bacterium 19S3-11]